MTKLSYPCRGLNRINLLERSDQVFALIFVLLMAFMRGSLLLIVVLLVKISFAFGEENNINFNIPPSSADKALNLFAQQADVQLLYSYKDVANKQLNGVSGLTLFNRDGKYY